MELLYQSINEKSNSHTTQDDNATIKKIKSLFMNSIISLENTSRTDKLWIQYHHLIEIVKGFIHAERLSDWILHLQMVRYMIPIFAAAGHIHYAKCARLYLQQMVDIEEKYPELLREIQG